MNLSQLKNMVAISTVGLALSGCATMDVVSSIGGNASIQPQWIHLA